MSKRKNLDHGGRRVRPLGSANPKHFERNQTFPAHKVLTRDVITDLLEDPGVVVMVTGPEEPPAAGEEPTVFRHQSLELGHSVTVRVWIRVLQGL